MENQKGHVLVLTYPAQGHINPLLQFAKRLASKGLRATLATTHYTIGSIKAERVHVEPISDGFDEGGYKQAPSTQAYVDSFKRVGSRTLSELITKFSETEYPVNCIVYDSLLPWALDVAKNFGIYAAVLLTNSASVCSLYWYINQGRLTFPLCPDALPIVLPGLPLLEFSDLPGFLADAESQSPYLALIMEKFSRLEENDWVFCNSFEELEAELVKALYGVWPLLMVGPLVPSAYVDRQIDGDTSYGGSLWNATSDQCSRWLDKRPLGSVIYVSFGSMGNISADQVEEIAFGLKASDKHFIWVLKDFEHKLKSPIEFLDSIQQRGLVVEWCNQLEVLAHPAVGCFMTHCGWNSTLEGLSLGVPMVGVPLWSDQPTNAKFLEEKWRVGLRARKGERGMVTREEVEMCVREVVEGERSEEFKKNALDWKDKAKRAASKGGSSDKNLDDFVAKIREGGGRRLAEP